MSLQQMGGGSPVAGSAAADDNEKKQWASDRFKDTYPRRTDIVW